MRRKAWSAAVLASLALIGCQGEGCQGDEGEVEERPIPKARPGSAVVEVVETHVPMGQGVALRGSDGAPVLVTLASTAGQVVLVRGGGHALKETGASGLVGLYRAGDDVLTLESAGARLFRLGLDGGALVDRGVVEVGRTPRVLEVVDGGRQAWVLARGEEEPLVRVSLAELKVVERRRAGDTPVDLEVSPDGAWLYVANLNGGDVTVLDARGAAPGVQVPVDARPVRLIAAPTGGRRVYVLHANSARLTAIDGERQVRELTRELSAAPTALAVGADGRWLYALSPGAGRLMVIDASTLAETSSLEVPVGSSDVVRVAQGSEERILVSTAERGQLQVYRAEGPNLRLVAALSLEEAAGRIAVGPGEDNVWLVGPRTGRVARFHID